MMEMRICMWWEQFNELREENISECFLCRVKFKDGDEVCEFIGGYAHFECFDKKMEENKKRMEADDSG